MHLTFSKYLKSAPIRRCVLQQGFTQPRFSQSAFTQAGFTLVELVVVIAIMAIIGGMSVSFVRLPVQGYVNSEAIAGLVDESDTAMKRMSRDLRNALPNSVRVTNVGANYYLEFIPIITAGRYRADNDATGTKDILSFETLDNSFDVLGSAMSVQAGNQLVIYNLGIDGADAYQGLNRRAIANTQTGVNNIAFTATGSPLPLSSPSNRFYIVNNAVSYVCNPTSKQLLRYEYALPAPQVSIPAQTTAFTATARLLASNVESCEFAYSQGVLQRSGQVSIVLTLSKILSGQTSPKSTLVGLVNIINSP